MAQIYGELIRAQLQVSASDLASPAAGLVYFNSTTGAKWYNGSAWKTAVDLDSSQTLANKSLDATCSINSGILPVVPLTKGGLGADASAWSGLVKISGGVASASSLALTDIPDTLITYAKLNLADGDIPQAKVSGLVTDLAGKLTGNAAITGATKTKITYDSKGLVTAGADLAAGDLPTGIDATKIADGSVDNTEFQKLGTAGTSGAGLLVTTDGLQTLSNKTFAGPNITGNMLFADTADIRFLENGGLDTVILKGPTSLASTYTFTLPSTPGQANQVLKTDGTGITSWGAGGSGAGGINYLSDYFDATTSISSVSNIAANGNITVNGTTPLLTSAWYADATSGSSAIARSTSTALRGSYNYLTAVSGTSTSGATFVQTSAFNVDSSDLGKPVTVSFDLTGVTTDDDWDIVVARYSTTGSSGTGTFVELIPVAGNVSSMTGTPGAKLPTGTTQFKGFFIASSTANDVYALRLRRRAGSAQVRLDSLFVGPQSLAQGAVVTQWQTYIPTITGTTTNPTKGSIVRDIAYWRRVGTNIELRYEYRQNTAGSSGSGSYVISIPTGLTIDSNYVQSPLGANQTQSIGTFAAQGASAYSGNVIALTTAGVSLEFNGSTLGSGDLNLGNSNVRIGLSCSIPISQWSSGTTTLADRAVEEYAWNSSTTTTSDTTSFGNGPDGVNIRAFAPTGNFNVEKRVRFQTPILSTDIISLEFNTGSGWNLASDAAGAATTNDAGSVSYGQIIRPVAGSNTDFSVFFNSASAGQSAWSGLTSWKWRVRKVSSGAAVGFPVSARNIVGDTSGTAVPSGYVGELITNGGTNTAVTPSGNGNVQTLTSISITPGVWDISGTGTFSPGSISNLLYIALAISKTNNAFDVANAETLTQVVPGAGTTGTLLPTPVRRIVVTNTTTIYLVGQVGYSTVGSAVWNANATFLRATRIA